VARPLEPGELAEHFTLSAAEREPAYLDTFEPFGPVLGVGKFLRPVYLGRVVSVLGADGLATIVEVGS
jgi:hypothetical protein